MVLFSLGLPSRFAEWCDAITLRLAQRALGSVAVVGLNSLQELALATITTDASHFVVCSRQPDGGIKTALAQANRRFIAVLEEPRAALRALLDRPGYDLAAATRAVASSCASMFSYVGMPGALLLNADRDGRDLVLTAKAIARHLELGLSEAQVAGIADELMNEGAVYPQTEDDAWWDGLETSEQALVKGALEAYAHHFTGSDFGTITWERELFYIVDEPHRDAYPPATRPVDVTGSPRPLVFGPYISLPCGSWSTMVALGFSHEAAEMSYLVEIFAGYQLTHVRIVPGSKRFVEVSLEFVVDAALNQPIQVRVWNERAAFDGRLALGHVTVTPHTTMRPETSNYFATALGA